jgi:hypothetical protein
MGKRNRLTLLAALLITTGSAIAQTWRPVQYYTFENSNPLKDSMGVLNLDATYYHANYAIQTNSANVGVGKYLALDSSANMIKAGPFSPDTSYTFEMLVKPGYNFQSTNELFRRLDGAFEAKMGYPYIEFVTSIKSGSTYINDDFRINFDGIGLKSYGYYIDGNWHHIVFKYSCQTGVKQIWVDGQCPTGFSTTTATGTVDNTSANRELIFDSGTPYLMLIGYEDEIAF